MTESGCLQMFLSSIPLSAHDLSFHGKSFQQIPQVACPALQLLISAHLNKLWSAALNLFLGQCCHRMPTVQKRGSTLSIMRRKDPLLYLQRRMGVWIEFGYKVQNCIYNETKKPKSSIPWTPSTNTSPSLFSVTGMEPPCLDVLNFQAV